MSKISFRVAHCSTFDPIYPCTELEPSNEAGKPPKGWQSARFCEFPQELIVAFDRICDISQIQILSHQSKISSKIEIYMGLGRGGTITADYKDADFKRLGYLSLDTNERSGWKARELKSVFVETRGQFVKLLIHKNHINASNLFNQVGVVALNVLGSANAAQAAVDDLALDVQLDSITVNQIRQLHAAKVKAVQEEHYDEAKRLKNAIEHLKQTGSQLSRLEKAKQQAVAEEDYDRAKILKEEIEKLRGGVTPVSPAVKSTVGGNSRGGGRGSGVVVPTHQGGLRGNLKHPPQQQFDVDESPPRQESSPIPERAIRPVAAQKTTITAPTTQTSNEDRPLNTNNRNNKGRDGFGGGGMLSEESPDDVSASPVPVQKTRVLQRVAQPPQQPESPSTGGGAREDNDNEEINTLANRGSTDDRPLPTSKTVTKNDGAESENPTEEAEDGSNAASVPLGDPEPLSAKIRGESGQLIDIMGEMGVRGLHSKQWAHRELALKALTGDVARYIVDPAIGASVIYRVFVPLLGHLLTDKVPQVFLLGVDLFILLLTEVARAMSKEDVQKSIEPLMNVLVKVWSCRRRIDDPNARMRQAAIKIVISIALNQYGNTTSLLVTPAVLLPLKATASATQFESRIGFLLAVIPSLGLSDRAGLSVDDIMPLLLLALQHKTGSVREHGIKLTIQMYQIVGLRLRDHFATFKPALLKTIDQALENVKPGGSGVQPKSAVAAVSVAPPAAAKKGAPANGSVAAAKPGAAKKPSPAPKAGVKPGAKLVTEVAVEEDFVPVQVVSSDPGYFGRKILSVVGGKHSLVNFKRCTYCGITSPDFSDDNKLDGHFWNDCKFLAVCQHCLQVIDIPSITEHLLVECAGKVNEPDTKVAYDTCPRCHEAVPLSRFPQHVADRKCRAAVPLAKASRCPLCHIDLPPGPEGWKSHLLGGKGCSKNRHAFPTEL